MQILICDDDLLIIEQLKKYIAAYFDYAHVKCPDILTFTNGLDLLAYEGKKDIVFLDIEMPEINGIYVGRELKKQNKNVLLFIVTCFNEYLDEAMRFHVFRYLSKPIDRQRLFHNLKDALEVYYHISFKIPIETKDGCFILPSSEIICVETQKRKVLVHTIRQTYESVHNIHYWLNALPANCFFQCHRSYIINFAHITSFDHALIHLNQNQCTAYLTRRKYTQFKEAYFLYLESMR